MTNEILLTEQILQVLKNFTDCYLCGKRGLHNCMGLPIIWSEEDKVKLNDALSEMFQWKKEN